jgi:AraC-like DNA-binding protein
MENHTFDLRRFIATQPIDKDLFKYKDSLYPEDIFKIYGRHRGIYAYILDWQIGSYSFLSEGIKKLTGFTDTKESLGIEELFQVIHPNDADPLQQIISKWMEILLGKPDKELNSYTANFNFRIRNNKGAYINLLQQPVFVSLDRNGNLVYEAGLLTDISRYKNDGNISLMILDPDHKPLLEYYPKEDFMPQIGVIRQKLIDLDRYSLSTENSWYREVQKVIIDNISNENLDVDMLCSKLNMSRSKFYRKLNKVSDMKPGGLIKLYRLLQSLSMLSSQDYSISEVAWKSGFQSHSYFSSCFRECFGCSPSQYLIQVK